MSDRTGFGEFVQRYNNGTMHDDAAWRAYNVEEMATLKQSRDALKILGYREFSHLGFEQAARDFDIHSANRARILLGMWWVWTRLSLGEVRRGKLREQGQ